MLFYLLLPALLSGVVGLQTGNSTTSAHEDELRRVEGVVFLLSNQTLNLTTEDDGVMKPGNNMTSNLHKDELSKLEEELELESTDALNITTEDDERFQDQEHIYSTYCDEASLEYLSHQFCGAEFNNVMMNISTEHWCDLDHIIRPYNTMTKCMEVLTGIVHCYYPNPSVQEFFLYIHSVYFQNCSDEGPLLADAPHGVVVVLTLIPVSLIPVLVFLVVWKSKVRE